MDVSEEEDTDKYWQVGLGVSRQGNTGGNIERLSGAASLNTGGAL